MTFKRGDKVWWHHGDRIDPRPVAGIVVKIAESDPAWVCVRMHQLGHDGSFCHLSTLTPRTEHVPELDGEAPPPEPAAAQPQREGEG